MFRTGMTVVALYAIGFGVPASLAPDLVYGLFGGGFPDDFTRAIARLHASVAVGLGSIAWLARGVVAADGQRAVALGGAVGLGLVGAWQAVAAANGVGNALVWGSAATHAVLAAWLVFTQIAARRTFEAPA